MKQTRIVVLLLGMLFGGTSSAWAYTIEGTIQEMKSGKAYLLKFEKEAWTVFDSASITNGHFLLKGKIGTPAVVRFQMDQKEYPLVFFALEDAAYTLRSSVTAKGWLAIPSITGGVFQERWTRYQKEYNSVYEQKRVAGFALHRLSQAGVTSRDSIRIYEEALQSAEDRLGGLTRQTILENKDNGIGSYLLYSQRNQYSYEDLSRLHSALQRKEDAFAAVVGDRLRQWQSVQPGKQAPAFTLVDPQGQKTSLADYAGKWVVLDFWASWCAPCRKENPGIVQWHAAQGDSSVLIVGVSLDHKKELWLQAIEKDGLKWPQLSDLNGWESPVARLYAVAAIPQKFLIDPQGRIILANTDFKTITRWLEQHRPAGKSL